MESIKKVLFVCLGNICRSPAAEGVFLALIIKNNLSDVIFVDSAGTIANHEGELPDLRMRQCAQRRGLELKSRARAFDANNDFEDFDYIITMDDSNYKNILNFAETCKKVKYLHKVKKMVSYLNATNVKEIPDPYFGENDGFELVLDLVEEASNNLLREIKELKK